MSGLLPQLILNGLFLGLLTSLPVCAFNLLYRVYRVLRLDALAVPLLSAYTALTVLTLSEPTWPPELALGLAAGTALVVAAVTLTVLSHWVRPSAGGTPPGLLIAAFASALALIALVRIGWGANPLPFPALFADEVESVGDALYSHHQLIIAVAGVVLLGVLARATARRPWQADEVGDWPHKYFALGWSAILLSAAGIAYALNYSSLYPTIAPVWLGALAAVCIGGPGGLMAGVLASFALGALTSIGATALQDFSNGLLGVQYQDMFAPLLLAAALAMRPSEPTAPAALPVTGTGHALGLSAFIGLLPWLAALAGGADFTMQTLSRHLPLLLIAYSFYAVLQLKLADLGFMLYPALGAYIYAWSNSSHLAGIVGEDGLASAFHLPGWSALPAAAGVAAGIALAVYRLAGRRTVTVFAVLTLLLGETSMLFINNLDNPLNLTNGPQGIDSIRPLFAGSATVAHVATTAVLALGITLMGALSDRSTTLRYALAAANAAVGGALMASMHGYISPVDFSMPAWFELAAIVLLVQRGGGGAVLAATALYTVANPMILSFVPEWLKWQDVALAGAVWLALSFGAARDDERQRSFEIQRMLYGKRPVYG